MSGRVKRRQAALLGHPQSHRSPPASLRGGLWRSPSREGTIGLPGRERWTSACLDAAVALVLACIAAFVARGFTDDVGQLFFYQNFMPETVMYACGHGLVEPVVRPEPLAAFLARSATAFDCSALRDVSARPLSSFTRVHYYLALAVGETWRWMGVSYRALWPLAALLHAAFAAGCFALARLFLPRTIGAAVGLAMAVSPVSVAMLFLLRDYGKAPFIIWACVLLVWTLRQHRTDALLAGAAAAGAAVGIGRGFRSDVLILLPVGILLLGFAFDAARVSIVRRAGIVATFMLAGLGFMWPTWAPHRGGEGLMVMEGQTEPFARYLGLPAALYDLGTQYADELAFSSVSADLRRFDPSGYDEREESNPGPPPQALARSNEYVSGWMPLFAADLATRAMRSSIVLLGFPYALSPERARLDPFVPPVSHVRGGIVSERTVAVYTAVANPWLGALGAAGLIAVLARVFARSGREAAGVGFLFVFLLGYPSLQFSSRHFFHLEVLFWIATGAVLASVARPAELRRSFRAFAGPAAAVALSGCGVYLALLVVQDTLLRREITRLLGGRREPVAAAREPVEGGRAFFAVPVPQEQEPMTKRPPDDLAKSRVETVVPARIWSGAERLLITIDGARCGGGPLTMDFVYARTPETWQPLDRRFAIQLSSTGRTAVLGSAFYRPTQHFDGFSVEAARADCVASVERLSEATALPSIFSAVLGPDWTNDKRFLSLW